MGIFRVLFAITLLLKAAGAAEIIELSGASSKPAPTVAGPNRYFGSPFTITITVDAPVAVGLVPDVSGISVTGKLTNGAVIDSSVIQTGSATLIEVPGTNRLQWRFRATPLRDGPATLTILPSVFVSTLNVTTTQAIILDTAPVLSFTKTILGTTITYTGAIISGIDTISPESLPLNKNFNKIILTNGQLTTVTLPVENPSITGSTTTIKVDAFGLGAVTCTALPDTIADEWENTNERTASTANVTDSSVPGSAPVITSITGVTPDNLVFHDGDTIVLEVEFSRAVQLAGTGDPFLALNSTGSSATAAKALFTGLDLTGTKMTFTYTVAPGNRVPLLDVANSTAFVLPSQAGLVGTDSSPVDYLADTTLAAPGSSASLSANFLYSINVEAAKPPPQDIQGAKDADKCAVGGGIGMILSLAGLGLVGLRRRR